MGACEICGEIYGVQELESGICKKCWENNPERAVKSSGIQRKARILVKTYKGNHNNAVKLFEADNIIMGDKGYFPISQSYEPGSWDMGAFLVAFLLSVILIGILVFIYMIVVKPEGVLTVTYEYKGVEENNVSVQAGVDSNFPSVNQTAEKICPQCAETVKAAAKICRYCRYEFKDIPQT